jgi:sRNA-binding regulator protein Hfq
MGFGSRAQDMGEIGESLRGRRRLVFERKKKTESLVFNSNFDVFHFLISSLCQFMFLILIPVFSQLIISHAISSFLPTHGLLRVLR